MLVAYAERPEALRPNSSCCLASQTMAKRSPPMPQLIGSIRPIAALVATAASTALPPPLSTSMPICAASGCDVATMPLAATAGSPPGMIHRLDRDLVHSRVGRQRRRVVLHRDVVLDVPIKLRLELGELRAG